MIHNHTKPLRPTLSHIVLVFSVTLYIWRFLRDGLASIPSGGTSQVQLLITAGATLSGK